MKPTQLSRREFLGLGLLTAGAAGAMAFRPPLPEEDQVPAFGQGRICWDWLPVRDQPSFQANEVGRYVRDQIVNLFELIESPHGPSYNPRWYRVAGGYLFSGYVQRVETNLQPLARAIPEGGQIAEVSVPYSNSLRYLRETGWQPLYRLYYQSTHWVTAIVAGPNGKPWYEITDDLHGQKYAVPAAHLRLLDPAELTPLSPHVDPADKRIEVSLEHQTLTAYEYDQPVFTTTVSTGVHSEVEPENGIPTDTPTGAFRINRKMPVRHMGNGDLVSDLAAYELPGVPWCGFFVATGVAFHGAYWHDNFGRTMSHGCVNMRPGDAKWLFRWTTPESTANDWYTESAGTKVQVF